MIELVAIFIGQTACPGTNAPGLAPAIRSALDSLAADAAHHSVRFRSIGIALDPLPTTGIGLLKRFGEFNEIAVGGGWASIGALWSLWQTHPSRADIPQLVIIARELVDHPRIETIRESVVLRLIGADEIMRWAPSPRLRAATQRAKMALDALDTLPPTPSTTFTPE